MAEKNESRARIMKSERLYHEERGIAKKKQKGEGKGKDKKGGRGSSDAASSADRGCRPHPSCGVKMILPF